MYWKAILAHLGILRRKKRSEVDRGVPWEFKLAAGVGAKDSHKSSWKPISLSIYLYYLYIHILYILKCVGLPVCMRDGVIFGIP